MHANPLSPSGFSFHLPFKYESPNKIYWGPIAKEWSCSSITVSITKDVKGMVPALKKFIL